MNCRFLPSGIAVYHRVSRTSRICQRLAIAATLNYVPWRKSQIWTSQLMALEKVLTNIRKFLDIFES